MRSAAALVLVSAHRFGAADDAAAENSLAALAHAIGLGVDYVEFDVGRHPAGGFVVAHDADQVEHGAASYAEVLDAIGSRVRAHIDLKLTGKGGVYDPTVAAEVEAVSMAVDRLGADQMVVTLGNVDAARALRDWAQDRGVDLLVGLSLGRWTELFPGVLLRRSRANLVVAHWLLARLGVAWLARRRGLPLLVWTVDRPGALQHWLRPGRCWMVTTNHPARALRIRSS